MSITLRPDQHQVKDEIYDNWRNGAQNVVAVAPTGMGKTVLTTDIILDGHNQGLTEIVMAHRNELVGQMSLAVARRGIKHRIIGSKSTIASVIQDHRAELGRSFVNPDAKCSVGSVQTIVSRSDQLRQWAAQVDRWTLDESHHAASGNIWMQAISLFTNARGLGVTACPSRADGLGLGRHADGPFDAMVIGARMRWLIDNSALADYEIVCPKSDLEVDDSDFAASGDLSPKKGRLASQRSHIVGDVVKEYLRYAVGRRTIVFATDIETANDMAKRFEAEGVSAAAVSSKSDAAYRREMIRRFRTGRLLVLINVDLFDEGFDVPGCDVVIMARPTGSLNKYLQMCGRSMRRDPLNPGKIALIIDMVSNWKRHGLPDKFHQWTLDRRDKRSRKASDPDDIELMKCWSCARPYERVHTACPHCGAHPEDDPDAARGASRTLEQVDGDLVLLDRDTLARLRAAAEIETPEAMEARVSFAAGPIAGRGAANRQREKIAARERLDHSVAQWAAIRRAAGDDDRMIHKRLYLTTGASLLEMQAMDRADMEQMAQTIEGWFSDTD